MQLWLKSGLIEWVLWSIKLRGKMQRSAGVRTMARAIKSCLLVGVKHAKFHRTAPDSTAANLKGLIEEIEDLGGDQIILNWVYDWLCCEEW